MPTQPREYEPRRLFGQAGPLRPGARVPRLAALKALGGLRVSDPRLSRSDETLGRLGSLEVRLAHRAAEIRRAQRLRFDVFYQEMSAVADATTMIARRDVDPYDALCDHLLVLDHARPTRQGPAVVGTYRLLRQEIAERRGGFYTAGEFDVAPLMARHRDLRFLELGRSCVLPPYRNKRTVELLWHGIWTYVLRHKVDVMLGCASLEGTDPGALALPLARAGHPVTGVDFSRGMLDVLERRAADEGLSNVTTVRAAWTDDWRASGVPAADVVIASRSLAVRDLRAALEKLTSHARRRVCVTLPEDGLFFGQLLAHAAVGRPVARRGDRPTAVGVLRQMGIEPEVKLLTYASADGHETREAAFESLRSRVEPEDEREEEALQRYAAERLVAAPDHDRGIVWRLEPPVVVRWAFLAWSTAGS